MPSILSEILSHHLGSEPLGLPLGPVFQSEVEPENCHPRADSKREQGEEDDEERDSGEAGRKHGETERGRHETDEERVGRQIDGDAR